MGVPLRKRVVNIVLCSTVLMLLTLALGYFIEEMLPVALLASLGTVCTLVRTSGRCYSGSTGVFIDLVFSVLLGVFMYLTTYYMMAGVYIGPQAGLAPVEYLLMSIKLSFFITHYVVYVVMHLVVGSLLLFLLILLYFSRA